MATANSPLELTTFTIVRACLRATAHRCRPRPQRTAG